MPSYVNSHDNYRTRTAGVTSPEATHMASPMPKKAPASSLDRLSGLRLRAVREAWDPSGVLKQESFAQQIGVTRTALANWEGGKLPDVRAMVRLHDWLGIPLEWIYLGQLRHVELGLSSRLAAAALSLGARPELPEAISRLPLPGEGTVRRRRRDAPANPRKPRVA